MKKIHRAWFVFLGCLLLQAALTGIVCNCAGVLIAGIRADTGFSSGALSPYFTIRYLVNGLLMAAGVKFFFKLKGTKAMLIYGACGAVSMALMSTYTQVWQFYISAVLAGIGTCCLITIIPIVINNWFNEHQALLLGITSAASGAAGALFGPVVSSLITSRGWRSTCVIMGIVIGVMVIVGSFMLSTDPKEAGLEPYGTKAETAEVKEEGPLPMKGFALAALVALLAGTTICFANQLPTFAQTVGYTLTAGSLFSSCVMIGNISGKVVLGALADRLGIWKALILDIIAAAVGFLLYLLMPTVSAAMAIGSVLFGLIYASNTIAPSRMLISLYGRDGYKSRLSTLSMLECVIPAFTNMAFPYIYDWTGSFKAVFIYCLAALAGSLVMTAALLKIAGKKAE